MRYRFGLFELDTRTEQLRKEGRLQRLRPRTTRLIVYLIHHRDRVVLRGELVEALWPNVAVQDRVLNQEVYEARKVLGSSASSHASSTQWIRTVRGRGFQFVGEVTDQSASRMGREQRAGVSDAGGAGTGGAGTGVSDTEVSDTEVEVGGPGSIFVGRTSELRELHAMLAAAKQRQGRALFLSGPAGVGKTRLVEEFLRSIADENQVAQARCYDLAGVPAYFPWIEIFREAAGWNAPAEFADDLSVGAVDVASIVPEIRELVPEAGTMPAMEPSEAEFRLHASIVRFFKASSRRRPVVLFIDDAHAIDPSSARLLSFLVRELTSSRVLLVATFRAEELARDHLLNQLCHGADGGHLSRTALSELSEDDVLRWLARAEIPGHRRELARALRARTGGNALFVQSLIDSWRAESRARLGSEVLPLATMHPGRAGLEADPSWSLRRREVPSAIRQTVLSQVGRASEEGRRLLEVASVVGQEFRVDTICRCARQPRLHVIEVLKRFVERSIVRPQESDHEAFEFAHPLFREALYESLPVRRQAELHHRVGEAFTPQLSRDPSLALPKVAFHFFRSSYLGASDATEAIGFLLRAAEQSIGRLSYAEGVEHLERALQLARIADFDPVEFARLRLRLGDAQLCAGILTEARATHLAVAEAAREMKEPALFANAVLGATSAFGVPTRVVPLDETSIGLLEEALECLPDARIELRARLLYRLSLVLLIGGAARGRTLTERAVAVAKTAGDGEAVFFSLLARFFSCRVEGAFDRCEESARAMVDCARENCDATLELLAHSACWTPRMLSGDTLGACRAADAVDSLHQQIRTRTSQWFNGTCRCATLGIQGNFVDAEEALYDSIDLGEYAQSPTVEVTYWAQLWTLRYAQERLNELRDDFERLVVQYPQVVFWRVAAALIDVSFGDQAAAERRYQEVMQSCLGFVAKDPFNSLCTLALLSELASAVEDSAHVSTLQQMLAPYQNHHVVAGVTVAYQGPVSRPIGLLCALEGKLDNAIDLLERSVESARAVGAPHFVARAEAELALLLVRRGAHVDIRRVRSLCRSAQSCAERMQLRGTLRDVQHIMRRLDQPNGQTVTR